MQIYLEPLISGNVPADTSIRSGNTSGVTEKIICQLGLPQKYLNPLYQIGNMPIYNEKMLLIDSLIHEFHRSMISGTINRRVAINFMDGTRKNIENILNELAR